ncbi:MAG: cupin domain-containing protein [Cellvibrionaceae bacterium]
MKKTRTALLFVACFCLGSFVWAAEDGQGFVIIQKDDTGLDERAGNRIKSYLLHGDPSKEGLYIMRIRFPAGQASRPHHHDQDRFITVIEGTWHVGTDQVFDMDQTVPIKAGGFMKHPAGAVHFDGAKDEAVVVEIRGMGPVKTTSVARSD